MKKVFLFLLAFGFSLFAAEAQILPAFGNSRVGTTGFQFLKIAPDARSAAIGNAVCANVNDVSSLYWNPAGLTKLDSSKIHFQAGITNYFAGVKLEYFGIAHRLKRGGIIGLSFIGLNTGSMDVTTEFLPQGNGQTFRAYEYDAAITYAKALTKNFSFGITGKFLQEKFAEVSSTDGVFDFGFQYEVGKANTRFSAGISSFGFSAEPQGTITIQTLNGFDTISSYEKIAVPSVFRFGVGCDVVKKENQLLTIGAQLNHPTDNNETFSFGGEYCWKKTFFARSGYEFGVDENGIPSFGFGVRFKRRFGMIQLDYAFQQKNKLGNVNRISVSVSCF